MVAVSAAISWPTWAPLPFWCIQGGSGALVLTPPISEVVRARVNKQTCRSPAPKEKQAGEGGEALRIHTRGRAGHLAG